jgi:hypothetical protein
VSDQSPLLDRAAIEEAFRRLGDRLAQVLDLHTADDVLAAVRETFPAEEPPARLRLPLEDIFSDQE